MDPNQMMFPMWRAPPLAAMPPPSDDPSAAPNAQPFSRGWKRKSSAAAYQPPALGDLQVQNRAKARRWFKNSSSSSNPNPNNNARKYFFPKNKNSKAAAPRNTTSFIIRAKRAGGIASLVSPCPVTPAVLPTPRLSPTREGLADMAQAQWGVDGYGSMKGLIRLRSSPRPASPNAAASDDDGDDGNSSGSDVEEHVEVERRLDHDLSRFEMVYPGRGEDAGGYVFEDDDDYDQDAHVARLEEENLTLKERLFLMEQEVGDMRRRLEALEARFSLENRSEDDAEGAHAGSEKSGGQTARKEQGERTCGKDAEEQGVVGCLENTGEHNAEKQGAVGGLEKTGEHNAEKQGAVGTEKAGEHDIEMVDSASEKTVDD
ncbi:hypothetical protein BS78_04G331000 [Paspalum vaginatum]|nr:hypothetical protein BS78_04G331000 [Paspalum vaginatum]